MRPITLSLLTHKLTKLLKSISQRGRQQSLSNYVYDVFLGEREYYVAFTNPDSNYPFQGLMKDGFRHCFVFYRGDHCWLMLNPTRWFMHIMELSCLPEDPFPEHLKTNNPEITILKITTRLEETNMMYFRPLTCVSHVAYILGLSKRFLFTPHQLYRCLKNKRNSNIVNVQEVL